MNQYFLKIRDQEDHISTCKYMFDPPEKLDYEAVEAAETTSTFTKDVARWVLWPTSIF
jgi:hypothetical protein